MDFSATAERTSPEPLRKTKNPVRLFSSWAWYGILNGTGRDEHGAAGWIIAILALLLAVCAGALIVYKRNLLKVRRSLENLRRTQSNGRLRLSVPDRDLERLLEEVNALLDERQASDALHRRQERRAGRRSPTSPTTCAPP